MGKQEFDLRCECSRHPLLAKAGRDGKGRPYVHIKVYKQRKIYGEIIVTDGSVRLRCRDCFRWFTVSIVRTEKRPIRFHQEPLPDALPIG